MDPYKEQGVVFESGESRLIGIAAIPEEANEVGVLILVGGPQYRVGSHRQFTLLARSLAKAGHASLRFDYAGMGDSEGESQNFGEYDGDIVAAIEALRATAPGISRVILWGLCDAASSAMMFAYRHPQVTGMILLNPWVHDGDYPPQVKLTHLYRPLLSRKQKWRRLLFGRIDLIPAFKELGKDVLSLLKGFLPHSLNKSNRKSFVFDMFEGLVQFQHDILIVLSEKDLTASEFQILIASEQGWRTAISRPGIILNTILAADHTFSAAAAQEEVSRMTIDWVKQH